MTEFLAIRGIIKKEEIKNVQEKNKEMDHNHGIYEGMKESKEKVETAKNRRSSLITEKYNCCCPPKSVYMPSFITDHKFDQLIDTYKKDKNK